MNREELLQKNERLLQNLNIEGLKLIDMFMGGTDKIEKYNIHTAPERIAQIEELERKKRRMELAEIERKAEAEYRARLTTKLAKRESEIASLTGEYRKFWDKIEKVRRMNISGYGMTCGQVKFISNLYDNNYIDASYTDFCYGFYQGMQFMKDQEKHNSLRRCLS